eukprot:NODE_3326_length_681_cov_98.208861_g2363_i0.p1 GENE.NODE_3326_length_681_cov_98.208861_g2363_i0~~NODE_3326_length_681_cov_98.208861_g2363_i0.p1  ORF type:complete len:120 (-),score=37.78 NODE_3326_length_681_cov_98.208861_g2363_i0:322-654(-)
MGGVLFSIFMSYIINRTGGAACLEFPSSLAGELNGDGDGFVTTEAGQRPAAASGGNMKGSRGALREHAAAREREDEDGSKPEELEAEGAAQEPESPVYIPSFLAKPNATK